MLSFLLPAAMAQDGGFALHDGDRVLFYGDSITDNQFYPQYVENYVVTRFPNLKITFLNYGWSGDKVSGGGGGDISKRLQRDLLPFKATVVTIMLGMNDGQYRAWDDGTARTFQAGYEHILDELKTRGGDPRLMLIKPSPYDDITMTPTVNGGGYNVVMQRYGDIVGQIATKRAAGMVDFNTPVVQLLNRAKDTDPENARRLIPDRVHPTWATHIVMGNALLKAWKAPSLVSSTVMDASSGVAVTDNALVRDARTRRGLTTWKELEGCLPVFFDKSNPLVALVLKCSNVAEEVNQEPLKVTNLPNGTYKLSIDDDEMGRFTDDQLNFGINLADLNTPMVKQAAGVTVWTARRQALRQTMWRNVVVPTDGLDLSQRDQAIRSLERLEADIIDHQRAAAKPVWHNFKLEKVG